MDIETSTLSYDAELEGGFYILSSSGFWQDESYSIEAKGLYTLLLTYAGQKETAWPGQATLAKKLRISEKSVRRAIKELREHRLITAKRQGQGKPNLYHIHKFHFNTNLRTVKTTVQEPSNLPDKNGTESSSKTVKTTGELIFKEIDSKNINGALPRQITVKEKKEHYRKQLTLIEEGNNPVNEKGNKITAAGLLAEMLVDVYGGAVPEARVVGLLAKETGGFWKAFDLIWEHSKDEFKGTAINWLMGCAKKKPPPKTYSRNGNGYSPPEKESVEEKIASIPEEWKFSRKKVNT